MRQASECYFICLRLLVFLTRPHVLCRFVPSSSASCSFGSCAEVPLLKLQPVVRAFQTTTCSFLQIYSSG